MTVTIELTAVQEHGVLFCLEQALLIGERASGCTLDIETWCYSHPTLIVNLRRAR